MFFPIYRNIGFFSPSYWVIRFFNPSRCYTRWLAPNRNEPSVSEMTSIKNVSSVSDTHVKPQLMILVLLIQKILLD